MCGPALCLCSDLGFYSTLSSCLVNCRCSLAIRVIKSSFSRNACTMLSRSSCICNEIFAFFTALNASGLILSLSQAIYAFRFSSIVILCFKEVIISKFLSSACATSLASCYSECSHNCISDFCCFLSWLALINDNAIDWHLGICSLSIRL